MSGREPAVNKEPRGTTPDKYGGVVLSDLGKKNYWKIFNPVTEKVEEPPAKRCKGDLCGEWMDWRTTGQIFKQKNGRYTYQQYCRGCRKTDSNDVNNNACRTSKEAFLKRLASNLCGNDEWLPSVNVRWRDTPKKYKPTQRASYAFVLKRLAACIDKVAFDPADSTHLDELTDTAVARLFKKVSEATLIGERTGIELILLSHSGMGMLSLDRENSDLAVNAPNQLINVDCIGFQRLKNQLSAEDLDALIQ
ncbi:hypothetical protein HDV05_006912, partial [Chytridiales sp. JEL 0842]